MEIVGVKSEFIGVIRMKKNMERGSNYEIFVYG